MSHLQVYQCNSLARASFHRPCCIDRQVLTNHAWTASVTAITNTYLEFATAGSSDRRKPLYHRSSAVIGPSLAFVPVKNASKKGQKIAVTETLLLTFIF